MPESTLCPHHDRRGERPRVCQMAPLAPASWVGARTWGRVEYNLDMWGLRLVGGEGAVAREPQGKHESLPRC
jgi:hypothetical protein